MVTRQERDMEENSLATQSLVTFRLDRQSYALPIEPVVQIIPMVTISPIPQTEDVVRGMINIRGAAIPVIDLRCYLGLPEASLQLHTPILLVQINDRMVGLVVDEVLDVVDFPQDQIVSPSEVLPKGLHNTPVLEGLTYSKDGIVMLLNLDQLFVEGQVQALGRAIAVLPSLVMKDREAAASQAEADTVSLEQQPAGKETKVVAEETKSKPAGRKRKKAAPKKETREAKEAEKEGSAKSKPKKRSKKTAQPEKGAAKSKPSRKGRKKKPSTEE